MTDIQTIRHNKLDNHRYRIYLRAIWIAIIGNGILVFAKGSAALFSGSTAVLATAVDSATDVLYTIVMAWGLYMSQQPADSGHPQGHSRIEPLIGAVIAIMMGIAGFEVIRQAIIKISIPGDPFDWGYPFFVLVGSGLVKVLMYILVRRLGRSLHSPAIRAFAADNLTDVFSSATALVGVLLAQWLNPISDPIAGLIVALWIFRNVFAILKENMGYLTGRAPDQELVERIHNIAVDVDGVLGVHQLIADYVGPQLRVDMHVDVDGRTTLVDAHTVSDRVQHIIEALDEVDQVFIHLEPALPLKK